MTKIDFYILKGESADERLSLVCRLAEKAISRKQKLFVHTDDEASAIELDKMLWSHRPESFIPHSIIREDSQQNADDAVVIAYGVEPDSSRPILINLANTSIVPFFFSRFERTLEIINDHAEIKAQGRDRWGFYKHRGYPLQHHKL